MKCPECDSSTFSRTGTFTTSAGWGPTRDSMGEYHEHDVNYKRASFKCSNEHTWFSDKKWRVPCPNAHCDYGQNDVKVASMYNGHREHKIQ